MNFKPLLTGVILFVTFTNVHCQIRNFSFSAKVEVDQNVKEFFNAEGRFYLFFSQDSRIEPRTQIWPNPTSKTHIFAKNMDEFESNEVLLIENDGTWISTTDWTLDEIPEGEYFVQILWDQDIKESRINAPGNLFSEKQKINVNQPIKIELSLSQIIEAKKVSSHDLVRVVDIKSEVLSEWWNKPINLKASVLLPYGYDSNNTYPIRYNIAGYGGRYTRINNLLYNKDFMSWWSSDEAPRIITVFLDGEGPFGDSYQMDSDNSGSYGTALINELIPHIESKYRGTNSFTTRFVDGCSTGGWVSLALQLYYPEFFNGVYSYSPDAVEFENYQLINIYRDKNAFVNEYGYTRPVMRDTYGEPMLSLKEFAQYENVLGASNSYLNSGGQFSAHTALYSPKGKNDLPEPLFDPKTGVIDSEVAEYWKKYDLKIYAKKNWESLGPKLQGKIFIWMGDMDHFYLNTATRAFDDFLKTTENPTSDAKIIFSPMKGHCSEYSHKEVLLKIQERIESLDNEKTNGNHK
jgi:S-formylglutathione hydrolase FrmB